MSKHNKKLGRWGEDLACDFLRRHGYDILQRNYFCVGGEIDIIAQRDEALCFIEVKTRRSTRGGAVEESVSPRKYRRVNQAISHYLNRYDIQTDDLRRAIITVKALPPTTARLNCWWIWQKNSQAVHSLQDRSYTGWFFYCH